MPESDGRQNRKIGRVIGAELLHQHNLAFVLKRGQATENRLDHLFPRKSPRRHQQFDIPCNTAGERPECQQVLSRVAGTEIGKDLLQYAHRKRLNLQPPGIASVQRLAVTEENLVHQPVHASGYNKIELDPIVILIPQSLQGAEERGIDLVHLLKLVNDYRQRPSLRFLKQFLDNVNHPIAPTVNPHPSTRSRLKIPLQIGAQGLLGLLGNQQIDKIALSVIESLLDDLGLANTATSCDDDELSELLRKLTRFAQKLNFFCTSIELHKLNLHLLNRDVV